MSKVIKPKQSAAMDLLIKKKQGILIQIANASTAEDIIELSNNLKSTNAAIEAITPDLDYIIAEEINESSHE
jgi:hypothetical protein